MFWRGAGWDIQCFCPVTLRKSQCDIQFWRPIGSFRLDSWWHTQGWLAFSNIYLKLLFKILCSSVFYGPFLRLPMQSVISQAEDWLLVEISACSLIQAFFFGFLIEAHRGEIPDITPKFLMEMESYGKKAVQDPSRRKLPWPRIPSFLFQHC